jgi:hypothetical protein
MGATTVFSWSVKHAYDPPVAFVVIDIGMNVQFKSSFSMHCLPRTPYRLGIVLPVGRKVSNTQLTARESIPVRAVEWDESRDL